ncbi:uncharacterized protein LOC8055081 [Sorghum bicolor]|jgi:hypothetical protein|uniref:uncharacterized protein LOC8055081 n=2 Tax=Sorghum bicolor TaxID=4558 RepID=UPI000B426A5B|nr:uncharacterized protein LOC8055081 [Sorghum bicolor]|eukprot:XP_021314598.1 uncharacterized protein LOC8055081 [Sorghum bicolor]
MATKESDAQVSSKKEFAELALDGHNFPTWAMDLKVSLSLRGMYRAIDTPKQGDAPLSEPSKYHALYIIRNHIHSDLKAEYLMEEDPRALWLALQQRYEQQKAVILPEATHEWNHLRIQDFKSVNEYNHAMHKLSSKLRFCEKEPSDAEKIEKTLSTMLPAQMILQQQYRERGFTVYSDLIKTLLQAERHNELLIWNSNQGPVGAKPLPEVHANAQKQTPKDANKNGNPRSSKGKNKRKGPRKPRGTKGKGNNSKSKDKSSTCTKCGCYNHPTKKCRTPKHLVELYLHSVGRGRSNQGRSNQGGQPSEAHFNDLAAPGCSNPAPAGPSNTMAPLPPDGMANDSTNNMIIEYNSDDLFGDYN